MIWIKIKTILAIFFENNLYSDEMTLWLIMRRAIWERHRVIASCKSFCFLHDTPKTGRAWVAHLSPAAPQESPLTNQQCKLNKTSLQASKMRQPETISERMQEGRKIGSSLHKHRLYCPIWLDLTTSRRAQVKRPIFVLIKVFQWNTLVVHLMPTSALCATTKAIQNSGLRCQREEFQMSPLFLSQLFPLARLSLKPILLKMTINLLIGLWATFASGICFNAKTVIS